MKIKYFQHTDTLYIEFRQCEVCETKDLDENTLVDLDAQGKHLRHHNRARQRAGRDPQILLRMNYNLNLGLTQFPATARLVQFIFPLDLRDRSTHFLTY